MAQAATKREARPASRKESGKNSVSLVEKAYQQIKRMLFLSELVAGQRLRYQDIAQKLAVSQTPVILALTRLENEGLVRSEANKGFYVPQASLDEARELYEMRALIEVFLVQRTARSISQKQLDKLAALQKEHASIQGASYPRERLWCDARLHLTLAGFSDHQVGEIFLRQLFDRLYLMYRPERLALERMQETEREHQALWEALRAHNPEQAAKILRGHIQRGQKHILEGLQREVKYRNSFEPWV
ncbi:MAG: GntR family transcriptional regulator [Desulfarculus sp.]|jgi:DNA-binding GntR family transcriptional regulator|nr:MAG: GntR family transcriptional regulator [Desulfarculus sp.]